MSSKLEMSMLRGVLAILSICHSALEAVGVPLERNSVKCTLAGTKVRYKGGSGKFDFACLRELGENVTM